MTTPIDAAELAQALIACPSVTPAEGGAQALLAARLAGVGFTVQRLTFSAAGTPDIANLYATIGSGAPHLVFCGHTDVVPAGDETRWSHPPFGGEVADGVVFGRGAVDMKGAIASFAAAAGAFVSLGTPSGTLSLMITGDEEGPAINGTAKLVSWAGREGHPVRRGAGRRADIAAPARRHLSRSAAGAACRARSALPAARDTPPILNSPTTRSRRWCTSSTRWRGSGST